MKIVVRDTIRFMWCYWIEAAAWAIGALCAFGALYLARTKGIGPRTVQALVVCLVIPLVLTLAVQKLLNGETVAALIGGLVGYGLPRDREP
jgi:hypothetical protein